MAGYRKVAPRNVALERLMEERDDLRIQIQFAAEKERLDEAALNELRARLRELDRRIDVGWRDASKA